MASEHLESAKALYEKGHEALEGGHSDDALEVLDQGIQELYAQLAQERSLSIDEALHLPRETIIESFQRDDLAARLMCEKGIAAFNCGDPALAEKLFNEAAEASPGGVPSEAIEKAKKLLAA
ncbi:MAG TPA: hypothetical protein VMU25_00160 [Candidatus Paceibacterota bacterium]|nr:hypothetical protein [Candidatus Paceibacterota bacterium]